MTEAQQTYVCSKSTKVYNSYRKGRATTFNSNMKPERNYVIILVDRPQTKVTLALGPNQIMSEAVDDLVCIFAKYNSCLECLSFVTYHFAKIQFLSRVFKLRNLSI